MVHGETVNRLANASSAYLKSAAHQPIDWYEYGPEAFARAKELDRPILLDIGAVWCHWCHVIDRESYENDEIAALINAHYVAVKVDRDQRPDIDSRYQQIVASMTGQGGWPLTAILSCDGRVIYGGTYFPPAQMKQLLQRISDVYKEQRDEIVKDDISQVEGGVLRSRVVNESETVDAVPPAKPILSDIVQKAHQLFDPEYGGFGSHPKFPHFSVLELLIEQAFHTQDESMMAMIESTLLAMANGGMYDHVGEGFHRYSVDRYWHVPHFEKMTYDNAEALRVYAQAFRLTGNERFKAVVEGIVSYMGQVLSHPNGYGFYASQDADIDLHDDGDYFTWTVDEMQAVLNSEELDLAKIAYSMSVEGNMHGRPGRNVLRRDMPLSDLAVHVDLPELQVAQQLIDIQLKLAQVRSNRPTPFIDDTIYLNWNGMTLWGYLEAANLMQRPDWAHAAISIMSHLRTTLADPSRPRVLHCQGISGFFEDYAWWIAALISAYGTTGDAQWLDDARHWAHEALARFWDVDSAGFFDSDYADEPEMALGLLKFRRKAMEDTPSSSANGIMIRNLLALWAITDDDTYRGYAEKALISCHEELSRYGMYVSAIAIGLFHYEDSPLKLTVLGHANSELAQASRLRFFPGKVISYAKPSHAPSVIPCVGRTCLQPINTSDGLDSLILSQS